MDTTKIVTAKEAITQANSKNSPLLRLPAELRNKIYAYVSDTVCVKRAAPRYENIKIYRSGDILSYTCTQIYSEAASIISMPRILHIYDDILMSDFEGYIFMALQGENTSFICAIEMPLRLARRLQIYAFLKTHAATAELRSVWNLNCRQLSARFPGLRYAVLTRGGDNRKGIAGKEEVDTDNRKGKLAVLRAVFCDGRDTLEMNIRD